MPPPYQPAAGAGMMLPAALTLAPAWKSEETNPILEPKYGLARSISNFPCVVNGLTPIVP